MKILNGFGLLEGNLQFPKSFAIKINAMHFNSDGQEGFIPSGFVYPADNVLRGNSKSPLGTVQNTTGTSPTNNSTNVNQTNNNILTNNNINALSQLAMTGSDDLRYHGTELVLLYDYKVRNSKNCIITNGFHKIFNFSGSSTRRLIS